MGLATKFLLREGIPYNLTGVTSAGSLLVEGSSRMVPGLVGVQRYGALGTRSVCWIGLCLLLLQRQESSYSLCSACALLIYQVGLRWRFPEGRVETLLGTCQGLPWVRVPDQRKGSTKVWVLDNSESHLIF